MVIFKVFYPNLFKVRFKLRDFNYFKFAIPLVHNFINSGFYPSLFKVIFKLKHSKECKDDIPSAKNFILSILPPKQFGLKSNSRFFNLGIYTNPSFNC